MVCLYQNGNAKRYKYGTHDLQKDIIKKQIIIHWNNFHNKPFDTDIKQYEEIRKLLTDQSEDYTTECL